MRSLTVVSRIKMKYSIDCKSRGVEGRREGTGDKVQERRYRREGAGEKVDERRCKREGAG